VTYRPPRAYRIGRNGMPEPVGYVYRGTGEDQGPHLSDQQLEPYRGGYDQWLPGFARGNNRPRSSTDPCPDCSYQRGGVNCRALCGAL
jgi:hypothetical protein